MKNTHLSITSKIMLLLVLLLLAVPAVFYAGFKVNEDFLEKHELRELQNILNHRRADILLFLEQRKSRMKALSSDGFIREELARITSGRSGPEALAEYLSAKSGPANIHSISVYSPSGALMAGDHEMTAKEPLTGAPQVLEAEYGAKRELAFIAPVIHPGGGGQIGVIAGFTDLYVINESIASEFIDGYSGHGNHLNSLEILLVNRDKNIIAGSHNSRGQRLADTDPVNACLETSRTFTGVFTDYRGVEVAGASACIPELKWTLITKVDTGEIFKPIHNVWRQTLVTFVITIVLISASLGALAVIMKRRLHGLVTAAKEISKGNYDVEVPAEGVGGEMEILSRTFNSMARYISARDSELRSAEVSLFEQISFLQTLVDTIPSPIFYKNRKGEYLGCNKAFEKALGIDRADMVGKTVYDLAPSELAEVYREKDEELFKSPGIQVYETRVRYADGSMRDIIFNKAVYNSLDGAAAGLVGMMQDITEHKRIESEREKVQAHLANGQKMKAIGELAGGIAHDFNNLLSLIKLNSSLALKETREEEVMKYLNDIKTTSDLASNLTRQLLIFSSSQPFKPAAMDLNRVASDTLGILGRLIPENIRLKKDFARGLWSFNGDKGAIEQLIMNLVINSRDAMPRGGEITVSTRNMDLDGSEGIPGAPSGRFIRISIEDTGAGMAREVLERIFEPLFSTKGLGKGTGLGLAVVHNAVKEHNGAIKVSSSPGKGTSFEVYLPAAAGETAAAAAHEALEPKGAAGAGQRILLIEDEKWLRKSVALVLSKSGYAVTEAQGTREAAAIFEREKDGFDLVFSDVVLKDGSGIELVAEFEGKKAGLNAVFTSGYMDVESQWPVVRDKGYAFLQKPYEVAELLKTVREALEKENQAFSPYPPSP